MSDAGDYGDEMFRRTHLDDETAERILTGNSVAGWESVASLAEDARLARMAPPAPSAALATLFAEGFSTDKGDLLVTAASNVPGPAPQAAGLPKWRKKNVIEVLLAKIAAAGVIAKTAAAAGAVAVAATGVAATGAVEVPGVTKALEKAGVVAENRDGARRDTEHRVDGAETADEADAGRQDDGASEKGLSTAHDKAATQAGDRIPESTPAAPAERPTADNNPGTGAREEAGTQRPSTVPTAEANPGSDYRGDAGSQQPSETPTADSNPSSDYRPAEQPTSSSNPGSSYSETGSSASSSTPAGGYRPERP